MKEKEIDDISFDDDETVCPNCGQQVEDESVCPYCGAILIEEDDEFEGFDDDEEM